MKKVKIKFNLNLNSFLNLIYSIFYRNDKVIYIILIVLAVLNFYFSIASSSDLYLTDNFEITSELNSDAINFSVFNPHEFKYFSIVFTLNIIYLLGLFNSRLNEIIKDTSSDLLTIAVIFHTIVTLSLFIFVIVKFSSDGNKKEFTLKNGEKLKTLIINKYSQLIDGPNRLYYNPIHKKIYEYYGDTLVECKIFKNKEQQGAFRIKCSEEYGYLKLKVNNIDPNIQKIINEFNETSKSKGIKNEKDIN